MNNSIKLQSRSHPVHLPIQEMGNRSNIVFLTVCTQERRPILNRPECVDILKYAWADARLWLIGRYMVMPNHVHLFCAPAVHDHPPLTAWVEYWKSSVARSWPYRCDGKVWQRHFWDRQLRTGERYHEKWEYVRHNPVRAGLVSKPEDWPWQGEMNVLMWHDS